MKFSYNWLQSFFDKKLPSPEQLADLLTARSFEAKMAGKKGNDSVLEIDILPNRAHDASGHLGIAREIAAILKFNLKERKINFKKSRQKINELFKVEVKDNNLCPRYTAKMVDNIKVGPSPKWLAERLGVCGLRLINNVVDACNYIMLETGQPLHAFDYDKLAGHRLIVRLARQGEKITTLDNDNFNLSSEVLVIADETKLVCIAGIKGGKSPEITSATKRIILESANFNPLAIRRASKFLKLETDASWRFERELDANLAGEAIEKATFLISELTGGEVVNGMIDIYPKKISSKTINLKLEKVKNLLDAGIKAPEIKNILERLGFIVKPQKNIFKVTVPTRRLDISIQEDLIEEIGRLYGYEKIKSQLPLGLLTAPERNEHLIYKNKIKDILAGLGFNEVYNYSFVSERQLKQSRFSAAETIEITNPLSEEQKYLRSSLVINLLKNIELNQRYYGEIKLFELAKVFYRDISNKPAESVKLSGVLMLGSKNINQFGGLSHLEKAKSFYLLKGTLDSLFEKLGVSDWWYDDEIAENSPVPELACDHRKAEVKIGDEILGWLAQVKDEVLKAADIKRETSVFELDFEKLIKLVSEERTYEAPFKYPAVIRDIAILVNETTKTDEVVEIIQNVGGELVYDVDLFDMYQGDNLEESQRSLAFHIIYQSDERTLTDKEVNVVQEKVIKALEEEGWEVRR